MTDTMTAAAPVVRTWNLSAGEAEYAITRLQRINERASRRGLATRYAWTLGPECNTPVWDEPRTPGDDPLYYAVTRDLAVTGDAPRLGGWSFLAVLTWDEGVLVTRCTPGSEARIDAAAIRERACDHCDVSRDRKDCYLLQHEDGRRVQVGSTCMRDFLGHDFTPGMITYGDTLDEIEGDCRGQGRADQSARVTKVLAWSAAMCAQTGWISRDTADERMILSSGDMLRMVLFGGRDRRTGELRQAYQPGPERDAEAAAVLAWCQHLDPEDPSEYIANLARAVQAEFVSYRNVALVGSAVGAFQRDRARLAAELAAPDPAASRWFGAVKDKVAGLEVTCIDLMVTDGYRGASSYKYTFADGDGNRIVWWASNPQDGVKAGTRVILAGTIKAHDDYRGVKATVLTRCKWTAQPGEITAMLAAHPGLAGLAETTPAERELMWVPGRQAAAQLAAGLLIEDPAGMAAWWTRWQARHGR